MGRRRSGRRRAGDEPGGSGGSASYPAAAASLPPPPPPPPPPPRRRPREDTPALRRRLLGLIRGFYLDAISRLPTADLRATLARGLLVGGACYGPLHPADNIVASSVWYAAAFPLRAEDRVEAGVIGAQSTDRAARRSLDRLLACLLHVCPSLSPARRSLDGLLWRLCRSRADLRVACAAAAASARCASRPSLLEPELGRAAFQVAAEAARHPDPAAFALLASSALAAVERDVARLLVGKRGGLSSHDIDRLSTLLLMQMQHPALPDEHELASRRRPPPEPSPKVSKYIYNRKGGAVKWCNSILEIADAALCKFATKTGLHYQLHTIYGDGLVEDEDFHDYFHINFMARPKEDHHSSSSGAEPGRPLFFFAEVPRPGHHDIREEDISICCLVEPSPPDVDNCYACLMNKYKINHPSADPIDDSHDLSFGGQCYEIGATDHDWNFRPTMIVDYLFFDSDRDNGLVEYLHNYFARVDANLSRLKDNGNDGCRVGSNCR